MIYSEIKQLNTRRDNLRWNAWGSLDNDFAYVQQIGPLVNFIRRRLNMQDTVTPSLRIADLRLSEPRIRGAALASLQRIFSKNRVKTDLHERVLHSAGRSYYDVLRLRMNLLKTYSDAVVYPETEAEIQKLLVLAARNNWAVIPYGGGSSVVGGVEAVSGGKKAVVTLDMTRMNRLIALSPMNGTATFEAGVYGPDLELALGKQGWTLGHFPQSFEYSTLGGWVAARSAGQQSSRYGKIEEIISAVRMVTPTGVFETGHFPAGSTGPDFNQVICGSEGTLGIITSVTVKLHPLPDRRAYCGFLFPTFARGLDFLRHANQDGIGVSTLRLSDESETVLLESFGRIVEHGKVHPVKRFLKDSIQNIVLQASGLSESKCIVIAGADGDDSKHVISALKKLASRSGGMYAGTGPGQRWLKGRFNMPFLRNYLMEFGIGVDTMETAVPYDRCTSVHDAVLEAMQKSIPDSMRMCHASHSYIDGACLYFTIIFPLDVSEPVAQWTSLKKAVSDAILANGGNISHHHGIGTDHREHFRKQSGPQALSALSALKKTLDPKGNMNPGKLMT